MKSARNWPPHLQVKIIAPYLEEIITSKNLHHQNLSGICQNILKIIPDKLELLLKLAKKRNSKNGQFVTKSDFQFVLNALWPEMIDKFEKQIPIVFSAGNPNQFHENYVTMMKFIKELETATGETSLNNGKVVQNFIRR